MKKRTTSILLLLLSVNLIAFAQEVKVTRITDKVRVFNFSHVSNCNIVAISSEKGIILVDTEISPATMETVKEAIQKEFPNKEFVYIINTHAHSHHCGGNAVFKELPIIAHENIVEDMQWWFDAKENDEMKQKVLKYIDDKITEYKESMKDHNNSSEVAETQGLIKYWSKRKQEIEGGFEIIVPNVRFSDRMTLQLGDITLNLIYFGKGHSKSDILIHIPEEKVLISGAVIGKDIPDTHYWHEIDRDITRWISVLKMLTENIDDIEYVIPGHGEILNKESVKLSYNYYSEMLNRVKDAKRKGNTLEMIKDSLSLAKGFSHFTQFQNLSEKEKERHQKNIEIFWNYIHMDEKVEN
jgi:cyclase